MLKAFDRVGHAGLLHELKSYGISGQIYGVIYLFAIIDDFGWPRMRSLHRNSWLMLEFPKAPFLVLQFFYYIIF